MGEAASALPGFGASKLQAVSAGKPIVARVASAPGGGTASAASSWLDLLMTPGASLVTTAWVEAPDLASLRSLAAYTSDTWPEWSE